MLTTTYKMLLVLLVATVTQVISQNKTYFIRGTVKSVQLEITQLTNRTNCAITIQGDITPNFRFLIVKSKAKEACRSFVQGDKVEVNLSHYTLNEVSKEKKFIVSLKDIQIIQ